MKICIFVLRQTCNQLWAYIAIAIKYYTKAKKIAIIFFDYFFKLFTYLLYYLTNPLFCTTRLIYEKIIFADFIATISSFRRDHAICVTHGFMDKTPLCIRETIVQIFNTYFLNNHNAIPL